MKTATSHFEHTLILVLGVLFLFTLGAIFYPALINDPGQPQWWEIAINLLILSIPLALLYGSLYMVVMAWRAHTLNRQVESGLANAIHWTPRIAALVLAGFLGLFSLDVFETQAPPLELLGGFLIHNIPSVALLLLLAFAWKRPAVGFVAFLAAGFLFAALFVRDFYALPNLLLFVLPILLIASLFYIDWKWLGPPQVRANQ